MAAAAPAVSVVVATHNRAGRLRRLLAALDAQEGAPPFEVIVVDNGSRDETPAVLAAADGIRSFRHDPPRGPAVARNTGWRAAAAPLVAFTDDDCEPRPGWLAALVAAASGLDVVQGRVAPHPEEAARVVSPWARSIAIDGPTPFFQTANILYRRALLERLGGFDEWFALPSGEDTDLGWRARAAGARTGFAAEALVWHAVHDLRPRDLVRGARQWHQGVRVVARHPELRAALTHRVFWKPSHERLLAAAALAGARRPLLAAGAVGWYAAAHRGSHGSWPGTLARLPWHVAIDGAEVLAMARGSVRERTLLL